MRGGEESPWTKCAAWRSRSGGVGGIEIHKVLFTGVRGAVSASKGKKEGEGCSA
jgi:hypothetical protein